MPRAARALSPWEAPQTSVRQFFWGKQQLHKTGQEAVSWKVLLGPSRTPTCSFSPALYADYHLQKESQQSLQQLLKTPQSVAVPVCVDCIATLIVLPTKLIGCNIHRIILCQTLSKLLKVHHGENIHRKTTQVGCQLDESAQTTREDVQHQRLHDTPAPARKGLHVARQLQVPAALVRQRP